MALLREEKFGETDWIAEQLQLDWRERQFLTDQEATGSPIEGTSTRKGKAVAHDGGALSRFATEAALKHLQSSGWLTCHKVRKIDETFKPVRGWMRLWDLQELLKADMVVTLADYADLPFLRLAEILAAIPGRQVDDYGQPIPLAVSLAEEWLAFVLYWFGINSDDAIIRRESEQGIGEAPQCRIDADRAQDARLLLTDRRWLFARRCDLPDSFDEPEVGPDGEDLLPSEGWLLLADIRSFRSSNLDLDWLTDAYTIQRTTNGDDVFTFTDARWNEAQTARKRAAVTMELNLVEPLRRFAHRNRKGDIAKNTQ